LIEFARATFTANSKKDGARRRAPEYSSQRLSLAVMLQRIEVRETVRATPVGVCIYCGSTDELTDEHVVPLGLGGRYVLPDSSCRKCAIITGEIERRVLRGFMLDARTAGRLPTRRPTKRPQTLPIEVERNGIAEVLNLAPEDHPGILLLPILEPPGFSTGREHREGVNICGYQSTYFGKEPAEVARNLCVKSLKVTTDWDATAFARMLAKIAYSYAVTIVGLLPRAYSPILPLILGTADDASFWMGSADFTLAMEEKKPLHALGGVWLPSSNEPGQEVLIVRVKLFVPSGAMGYEILAFQR
jgi:hypothetical protein